MPWFGVTDSPFGNHTKDSSSRIQKEINIRQQEFSDEFMARYKRALEDKNNEFKKAIENILENTNLNKSFKEYVNNIKNPEVVLERIPDVSQMFDENKKDGWFWKTVDEENFINSLRVECKKHFDFLSHDFKKKVIDNNKKYFESMIGDVKTNIKNYSSLIKAQIKDKKSIEKFKDELSNLKTYIKDKETKLKNEIWKELDE